jgi:S-methylmethionine-dependent homocysteine/selenocysteine methylase
MVRSHDLLTSAGTEVRLGRTAVAQDDPLAPFLQGGGGLVLDGGLATELEKAGFDLDHPLWSARLLMVCA